MAAALASIIGMPACSSAAGKSPITIDDVLGLEHVDQVVPSPDGETIAVVIQRPAKDGEVYGRTAYETDPSRNDVWLITRSSHERRNITNGASLAAGFWCASWSPDGRRLAMLSTRPEGNEPRGGDNVHLYVWDRDTDHLSRLGSVAIVTQTRYGGALHHLDLRGGADRNDTTRSCGAENFPYLWLKDYEILAATLPDGQVSGLIDEASRPFRVEAQDARRLRDGSIPTAEALGSGAETAPPSPEAVTILRTFELDTGQWRALASVPHYPFTGDLSLSVSPDGRKIAVMAPVSAFPPVPGRQMPNADDTDWTIEKRLGVIDLGSASIRWLRLPDSASHPLELFAWSPDSHRFALRARHDPFDGKPVLLVADSRNGRVVTIDAGTMDQPSAGSDLPHQPQLAWINASHMLARCKGSGSKRLDWWRIGLDGRSVDLTAAWKSSPSDLRRLSGGRFAAIDGANIVTFDPQNGRVDKIADLGGEGASFVQSLGTASAPDMLIAATAGKDGEQMIHAVDSLQPGTDQLVVAIPGTATPLAVSRGSLLWQQGDQSGLLLNETDLASARTVPLLSLDTALGSIDWGRTIFFDYQTTDGVAVKGGAILPPGYRPGHRYPTLVWVYDGYRVQEHGDYFLDPQMPGFYNLQLYAAAGYVVLLPSMPFPPGVERKDVYASLPNGVLPAIDKLSALGIADPARIGVFGQSYGGYSVYGLLSQTDRFKAGVAMAGITDLVGFYEQPAPLARGYPGIAHEMSVNWGIAKQFGLYKSPVEDHEAYWRNSPLAHVDGVHTPLLMLHGTGDIRGSITQADQFFYALYAQNKTARLVRYGGESHSLAQSPANIRDVLRETILWFDKYVKGATRAGE